MPSENIPSRRLKILVNAYACDPNQGSEPGIGWNWVSRLAAHHELWILTEQNRCVPALHAHLACNPELARQVHIIGIQRRRYGESIWSHLYYLTYRLWQREAYKMACKLHQEVGFDLVHQLNMIGYREPGYLWQLPLPFVWGPIGGHAQMPWRFIPSLGRKGAFDYSLRNVLNWIQMRTSLRVRRAMRRADVLVAATEADRRAIRQVHGREAMVLNDIGAAPPSGLNKAFWDGQRPLRLVWCGLLIPRKALPLALQALASVGESVDWTLDIVGDGAWQGDWKRLASKLGIYARCRWHGQVTHADALAIIRRCDLMLLSSLQDETSTVVMEALQYGLPIICHDSCGFGTVVDGTCGIKIPVHSPQHSVAGFAEAVQRLAADPAWLARLSAGALARARELSWENKIPTMLELYEKAISNHRQAAVVRR